MKSKTKSTRVSIEEILKQFLAPTCSVPNCEGCEVDMEMARDELHTLFESLLPKPLREGAHDGHEVDSGSDMSWCYTCSEKAYNKEFTHVKEMNTMLAELKRKIREL